ncbi:MULTISPECIES: 5-oxoprolinase subunit PxpB [unclassified Bacillus (in: firmicutes)]|uniref:5-oxoprolinase subunit PxpB n=1 Tax=unclassified Bacillus (in: firmicutes) TaxID=185979 RepID=UPI002FFFB74C
MSNLQKYIPEAMVTGENSIRFCFGQNIDSETFQKVRKFCMTVERDSGSLIEEVVPSYHAVTVYYKKEMKNPNNDIKRLLTKWELCSVEETENKIRKLHIPVCYDDEFSLDIERVMKHTQLSKEEIIYLHAHQTYTVYMIGFLPGFPYLGGLNEKLATPRLDTPRAKVSKGTVGIGNNQTGIYPLESPGGWNIIGRTPLGLYLPDRSEPFFIQAGDQLEFLPISMAEYDKIKKRLEEDPEEIKSFIMD